MDNIQWDHTAYAETILKGLGEDFPAKAVKKRDGPGGKKYDYIQTHTAINRLNNIAKIWDWSIVSMDQTGDLVKVVGRLTIPGVGSREGVGVQTIKGGEDLWKGANSDALKNAAKLFGVAIALYGTDYEDYDETPTTRVTTQPAVATNTQLKNLRNMAAANTSLKIPDAPAAEDPRNYWAPCSECGENMYWRIQPNGEYFAYDNTGAEHLHDEAPETPDQVPAAPDDKNLLRIPAEAA